MVMGTSGSWGDVSLMAIGMDVERGSGMASMIEIVGVAIGGSMKVMEGSSMGIGRIFGMTGMMMIEGGTSSSCAAAAWRRIASTEKEVVERRMFALMRFAEMKLR